MPRALGVRLDHDLPPRTASLGADSISQIFGGCVAQGGQCTATEQCCPVFVQPGDYVLCYYYRSERLNTAYCTKSSIAYG